MVYRLCLSMGGPNSGWGNWTLYEDRKEFEERLLDALIEAAARNRRKRSRACWTWFKAKFGKEPEYIGVEKVIAAEALIDGEWVDMEPRLVPPSVVFEKGSYQQEDRTNG